MKPILNRLSDQGRSSCNRPACCAERARRVLRRDETSRQGASAGRAYSFGQAVVPPLPAPRSLSLRRQHVALQDSGLLGDPQISIKERGKRAWRDVAGQLRVPPNLSSHRLRWQAEYAHERPPHSNTSKQAPLRPKISDNFHQIWARGSLQSYQE
jgi:hypothetical protein